MAGLDLYTFIVMTLLAVSLRLQPVAAAPTCGLVPPKQDIAAKPSSSSFTPPGEDEVVATAWYPGWLSGTFKPSMIPWEKYSSITFAFAVTTQNAPFVTLDDQSKQALPDFVSQAHTNGAGALLSIGGWTGSQYFSTAVQSANQATFIKSILGLVDQYQLDGIDFDWEYPNKQGIGCNIISDSDSANYLSFLQSLRKQRNNLTLTAAVGMAPFNGPGGTPMTDVSGFGAVLDHIAIMNYDIWGSWSPDVGPNAPLDDLCAQTQAGSASSAVKAWTGAKFPANKIVLGVAAYGHSFHVDKSNALDAQGKLLLYPPFDKAQQPPGDSDTGGGGGVDQCGNPVGLSGTFNFAGMIQNGFLGQNGTAAPGVDYTFDSCSQTPFVYNSDTQVMISYDDATSFSAKGKFINDQGLKGFAMWHVAGDSDALLVEAISIVSPFVEDFSHNLA